MKAISIFVLLLLSQLTTSQTYILDSTFGNNGQIQYNTNTTFRPTNVVLVNNNYFHLGYSNLIHNVIKTDFTGQFQSSFGANGVMTFPSLPANQNLGLSKLIYTNNAFYAYGYVSYSLNSVASNDVIIYKFDENGILDSAFGINGAARINLGDNESITNIIVKDDGSIYCSGKRSNKIVYFKLTTQGALDYNFDSNGYKTIDAYPNSSDGYLIPYGNGDYLLVGFYKDINLYGIMFITKINEYGVIDTSFGNNGYKTSQFGGGIGGHEIRDVQLYQNKLYIQHHYRFGLYTNSSFFKIYDLNVNQSIYDQVEAYDIDFIVKSDGIYIALHNCPWVPCTSLFTLRKRSLNGVLDTTFHINGSYTYSFPNITPISGYAVQSIAHCLHINDSGQILMSGYSAVSTLYFNFASMRIIQGELAVTESNLSDLSIHPNPFTNQVSIKTQEKISNLKIYSLNGTEICEPEINNSNGDVTIDLTSIKNSGVYILKFYSNNTQVIKKLIKI